MIDSTDAPEGYYAAPIEETRKYVTKCKGCAFLKEPELICTNPAILQCSSIASPCKRGHCFGSERPDRTGVIFKKMSDTQATSG